mmetsp:Transcript_11360/g.46024  ORF Transcript_11360/g.46024 Transcript_11360/m.46024 type:complete len:110 (-) Transcript_11360:264-593(-)
MKPTVLTVICLASSAPAAVALAAWTHPATNALTSAMQKMVGPSCDVVFDAEGFFCKEDLTEDERTHRLVTGKGPTSSPDTHETHQRTQQVFDSEGTFEVEDDKHVVPNI